MFGFRVKDLRVQAGSIGLAELLSNCFRVPGFKVQRLNLGLQFLEEFQDKGLLGVGD